MKASMRLVWNFIFPSSPPITDDNEQIKTAEQWGQFLKNVVDSQVGERYLRSYGITATNLHWMESLGWTNQRLTLTARRRPLFFYLRLSPCTFSFHFLLLYIVLIVTITFCIINDYSNTEGCEDYDWPVWSKRSAFCKLSTAVGTSS